MGREEILERLRDDKGLSSPQLNRTASWHDQRENWPIICIPQSNKRGCNRRRLGSENSYKSISKNRNKRNKFSSFRIMAHKLLPIDITHTCIAQSSNQRAGSKQGNICEKMRLVEPKWKNSANIRP